MVTLPGFVFVPAGAVGFGAAGNEDVRRNFLYAPPLHDRHVDGFLIAIDEVTIGDWLRFVDAQPPDRRDALTPRAEAKVGTSGAFVLTRTADGWAIAMQPADRAYRAGWGEPIVYPGRTDHAGQDWRRFPIAAITATDAEAYAAWLDASAIVPGARLCTELEWERAARGVDGRGTPTGATLELDDANLAATHGHELMGPDEIGSHPRSTSVFGVRDLAGNAYEWTRASPGDGFVLRGGSFFHDRLTAHLANRNESVASLRDPAVGMRLCATPRRHEN